MNKQATWPFNCFFAATLLLCLLFLFKAITDININELYGSFLSLLFYTIILAAVQQLPVTLPFQAEVRSFPDIKLCRFISLSLILIYM